MKVLQKRFWFNEPHDSPLPDREIFVDGFAGGGGASVGIEAALGRQVDVAINHNPAAIAMHMANHPQTKHYCENIWDIDPVEATEGRPVGGAWFSPDCTHFSKARVLHAIGESEIGRFSGQAYEIKRTLIADSFWTDQDAREVKLKIGQVKRRGHVRLTQRKVKVAK